MNRKRPRNIVYYLLIACVFSATFVWLFWDNAMRNREPSWDLFQAHISEYVGISDLGEALTECTIKGPAVVVDRKKRKIDPIFAEIPRKVAAHTPEEVLTIIWVDHELELVGRYTGGLSEYQDTWEPMGGMPAYR